MNSAMPPDPVFRALADPTRRAMLLMLSQAECSANELATPFSMSQPAVSQHLKVLREAGLVQVEPQGRARLYRIDPAPLRQLHDWLEHFEQFWEKKLDKLGDYLDKIS